MNAVPPSPPPPPPGRPPGPPPGPPGFYPERPSRRGWWIIALAAGVVVLIGAALAVNGDSGSGTAASADEVVLEPVDKQTPDPFMDESLDLGGATGSNRGEGVELTEGGTSGLSNASASGDAPGLYGGSEDEAICDVERQVAFLTDPANADKAQAWANVHGLSVDQVGDYLRSLTPVRLLYDTRVTNHSFSDRVAQPVQSVLQAGTAVLVDDHGVPRSKCFCGNPLVEPAPVMPSGDPDAALDVEQVASNPDDAWEGLDPAEVVTVGPSAEPVEKLVVTDPKTGEQIEIPVKPTPAPSAPPVPGEEESSAYILDELQAAFPSDGEIKEYYQSVERCTETGGRCMGDDTAIEAIREDDYYGTEILAITAYVHPDAETAASRAEVEDNDNPGSETAYEHGGWEGTLRLNRDENFDDCTPNVDVARDNIQLSVALGSSRDCATTQAEIERWLEQIIDNLG